MKTWLLIALLIGVTAVFAFQGMPRCTTMEPDTGKAGDSITLKGEQLDKGNVSEVYVTDGSKDTKAVIGAQSAGELKFTIPKVNPGRYHIALLTANRASFVEQPVVLTVE